MAHKLRYRRYRRSGPRPAYTINHKYIRNLTWDKLGADGWFAASVQLVNNPSVLTSNSAGNILTVKHLKCQLQNLPTYFGINSTTGIYNFGQLEGGWICVYVPEGTNPNRPFPDLSTGTSNLTLYEPNQFVLGHGTWLEGGSYFQTNRPEPILENGALGYNRYSDTPPGNLCRITIPLSKRLNPGDSIYMIYYAKGDPNLISGTSIEGCETIVSYASKAN